MIKKTGTFIKLKCWVIYFWCIVTSRNINWYINKVPWDWWPSLDSQVYTFLNTCYRHNTALNSLQKLFQNNPQNLTKLVLFFSYLIDSKTKSKIVNYLWEVPGIHPILTLKSELYLLQHFPAAHAASIYVKYFMGLSYIKILSRSVTYERPY